MKIAEMLVNNFYKGKFFYSKRRFPNNSMLNFSIVRAYSPIISINKAATKAPRDSKKLFPLEG